MGTGALRSGAERWHLRGLPPAAWIAKRADAGLEESMVGNMGSVYEVARVGPSNGRQRSGELQGRGRVRGLPSSGMWLPFRKVSANNESYQTKWRPP